MKDQLDIENFIKDEENKLDMQSDYYRWYILHKIPPKPININGINMFLLTEHTGKQDSGYRIVLNPTNMLFGLEITNTKQQSEFIGYYGERLKDTILEM